MKAFLASPVSFKPANIFIFPIKAGSASTNTSLTTLNIFFSGMQNAKVPSATPLTFSPAGASFNAGNNLNLRLAILSITASIFISSLFASTIFIL